MTAQQNYQPIESYGIIGDLHTVALVGMDGSIDFMAFPHFDSPTIFATMLDKTKGGYFKIAPTTTSSMNHKQLYLTDTNILLTRFLFDEGVVEISDFMPIESEHSHKIIRRVKCIRGEVHMALHLDIRFDYSRAEKQVSQEGNITFIESLGTDQLKLSFEHSVPVSDNQGVIQSEFKLTEGQTATFVLQECHDNQCPISDLPDYVKTAFKKTVNFWRAWIAKSNYKGRWREMVNRSALILKLLTSQTYGSTVAAPTFGLPEKTGGERNWDYRYTWIRDSSFTLYGLMRLGFTEEATSFMNWIEARCQVLGKDTPLQIMYGLDGKPDLTEEELNHFEGYKKSSPVRIGNGAYDQLQLDIYGELMDSVYIYDKFGKQISYDFWKSLVKLVDWVCHNWQRKDEGIWEVRGSQQAFLYSRLMCWVAIDRGIRLAQKRSFPAPLKNWQQHRDEIYNAIFENFWNEEKQAFVQYKDSTTVDASNLLMPLVRFISPTDPKWLSTLKAIEKELVSDSLVFRYRTEHGIDGLSGEEGTFCMCSFWYVECVSRSGDLQKARFLFEKMLGYANHLGLYAEELGPKGEHLGNFPQAFTHLALISAAFDIDRRLK